MNAVGSISYTTVPGFPAGSAVDHIVASIMGSIAGSVLNSQNVPPGTTSVTFTSVAADTYTFSVQAVDVNGTPFGTAVTGSFTVTAASPTVSLSLPSAASFTQA